MALTFEQMRAELTRYAYRPGWALSVYEHPQEGPFLKIVASVPDAYDATRMVPLVIRSPLPPMPDVDAFGRWLLWRLMQAERHECCEFLRRDGEPLADPHADHERLGL